MGAWLIVWAAVTAKATTNPYRCTACGTELLRPDEGGGVVTWEPLNLSDG